MLKLSKKDCQDRILSALPVSAMLPDHSKFGSPNLEVVCPLSDVDRLVTDIAPPGGLGQALVRPGAAC